MEYKDTLNLPKTDFGMRADLIHREPLRLQKWQNANLYGQIRKARAGSPRYVLHDGPPFANGEVHIGTALNKILKDIIIRYKTLCGFDAPYVPGWDCHGLPIEFKVIQQMRKEGKVNANAYEVRKHCKVYARKFIDLQKEQFKRLGVLGEWDDPYLTFNKRYEAEELRLFADLVEKGFVYRGKKPVYWSIPCQTALAEAEVEYQDHRSQSVYVKFPVIGIPKMFVLIWTTTPWTLPANLAVAFNPKLDYAQIRVGEETYLVSIGLLDSLAKKCEWDDFEITRNLDATQLSQVKYQHPFCNRMGRLYEADFVDATAGTGFVHIAPGHGLEDYGLGMAKGLPIYSPIDDAGCLSQTRDLPIDSQIGNALIGKSVLQKNGMSEADEAVIDLLKSHKRLLAHEPYLHSYPHCWRSKTPVIFRAMNQWFIHVDHENLRSRSMLEINRVDWIPDWGKRRIEAAIASRPDWCVSRQRSWGVPLPAFFTAEGEAILDAEIIRKTAALIEEKGSDIWFELSCESLWKKVKPDDWAGEDASRKSKDTLDVWIDSGSSSRSVTMIHSSLHGDFANDSSKDFGKDFAKDSAEDSAKNFQADLYLEGSDQHRGWFQSSLLLSLAGNGGAPFRSVLTHGFMVNADREKISKSKSGGKPQSSNAYVKQYGADWIRLWVASQDFRNDIAVSAERIQKVGESYRAIRNALRYQLANLYDFHPDQSFSEKSLTLIDRWILWRLDELSKQVLSAYDRFEFHIVYQKIVHFVITEVSAIFHDAIKDRLYTLEAKHPKRRSSQSALYRLVKRLGQLLSPILAFTTDEVWEHIPGNLVGESIHTTMLKIRSIESIHPSKEERETWTRIFKLRDRILPAIENQRRSKTIGKALEAIVILSSTDPNELALTKYEEDLREILNVSRLMICDSQKAEMKLNAHSIPLHEKEGIYVFAAKTFGLKKCARCWHWEMSIGNHAEHPSICTRCVNAIAHRI